jgi:hypothetical protein
MTLFTDVRGIGILRTSPFGDSRKFALKEFCELRMYGVLRSWLRDSAGGIMLGVEGISRCS